MSNLFRELQRRNVFRVAVAYLVLAWLVLQVTDLVAPPLGLPEWTMSMVIFLGLVGFPFALLFAWAFELTPEGLKRSEDVEPDASIATHTGSKLKQVTTALLVTAVIVLLLDRQLGLSEKWQGQQPGADDTEVSAPVSAQASTDSETAAEGKPQSIAVLPFVNMSEDPNQEYFSDGISEELLNGLAKIRELRVAARTSSFAFKGKNQDISEIGRQLKVRSVLEGSVRKSGQRVRITAQLINAEDGYHLWSETYDRELTDIFAVQDEISAAIVDALKVHLTDGEDITQATPVDIEAYNWALQGRQNIRARTGEALRTAVQQYQKAIDIEPDYAEAWAGKAMATLLLRDDQYGDIPTAEAARVAQKYLDRAFAIDPGLSIAHGAQSLLYQTVGDDEKGLASIDRAIATNPSVGVWHMWRSQALTALNREQESDRALEKAYEVDPLHTAIRMNYVQLLVRERRFDEARALTVPGTAFYFGVGYLIAQEQGEWARQVQVLEEWRQTTPERSDLRERSLAQAKVEWLMELDVDRESVLHINEAVLDPQSIIDKYSDIPPLDLDPGIRHVYLVALSAQDRCADILEFMAPYRFTEREPYDSFHSHSDFALALMEAECEAVVGQRDSARPKAQKLLAQLESQDLPPEDAWRERASLLFLAGNSTAAREILDPKLESGRLSWSLHMEYPSARLYDADSELQHIWPGIEARLNRERAKLGWPPVEL